MKFRKYWSCYAAAFLGAAGLRYLSGSGDSERLLWLLAPAAWWVRMLGGLEFVYEPGMGYVNHEIRFIIAPACAGVRFLTICMLMLVCSFVHRTGTWKRGTAYTLFSMGLSWLFTGFVNGLRILLTIGIPSVLERAGTFQYLIAQEQLHTAIGTVVYFLSLLALYGFMDAVLWKLSGESGQREGSGWYRYVFPALWYVSMVLVLPLLLRIVRNDFTGFAEYARLIMRICLISLCVLAILVRSGGLMKKCLPPFSGRSSKPRTRTGTP